MQKKDSSTKKLNTSIEQELPSEFFALTPYDYDNILNSFESTSIFVISESEHRLLYFNDRLRIDYPGVELGNICHDYSRCDCEACPIYHLNDTNFAHAIIQDIATGNDLEMTATRIMWHDNTPAFLIRMHPHIKRATLSQRTKDIHNAISLSQDFGNAMSLPKKLDDERSVIVGHFTESLYYLDESHTISDEEQILIDKLLVNNQAVGIIAGYFDEDLTIRFMSEIAIRALGFEHEYKAFYDKCKAKLLNLFSNEKEKEFVRHKLETPSLVVWSLSLKGYDDTLLPFRLYNNIGIAPNGKKMWYLSLRRSTDVQFDYLTGGHSYASFIHAYNQMVARGENMREYAFIHLDIKEFKIINELFGTKGGNHLLRSFFNHLKTSFLQPVLTARSSADHFGVLVKKSSLNLDLLPSLLEYKWSYRGNNYNVKSICGIYYIDFASSDIDTIIQSATLAANKIDSTFTKPYIIFDPSIRNDYVDEMDTLKTFEETLNEKRLLVYYQPIIDCRTEKPASAEALVRWKTSDGYMLSPGMFLPILEKTGEITKLDKYVFFEVVDFLHKREAQSQEHIPISINLSRMDFFDKNIVPLVNDLLDSDPIAKQHLHFEITETAFDTLTSSQTEFVKMINSHNSMVYLDDFGVANSSTDMLLQYDFSVLKIDMKFVRQISLNPKSRAIIKSTVHLAHGLSMKVIAEGVETKEEYEFLRYAGADYVQGYYFSKPLSEEDFNKYLEEHL